MTFVYDPTARNLRSDKEETVVRAASGSVLETFKAPVLCLSVARYDGWLSGLVLGKSSQIKDAWKRLGTFSAGFEGFSKAEERDVILL